MSNNHINQMGAMWFLTLYYLIVPYAADVQPAIKEHKTINAKKNITSKVISLVDTIKSAMAPRSVRVFAIAA